eukprot:TRINITY_DN17349_c0_g1_i1.p1 TRINITY_DN17349_c0_g1~~TRINITY_DN17349_c0_g1_i1.p1  ORF type:complete len:821 (+),score=310.63 TRINITY_DN17349_c0_g1_i1:78-2465(+)
MGCCGSQESKPSGGKPLPAATRKTASDVGQVASMTGQRLRTQAAQYARRMIKGASAPRKLTEHAALEHVPGEWTGADVAKKTLDTEGRVWILVKKDPYVVAVYNAMSDWTVAFKLAAKDHQRMDFPAGAPRPDWAEEGDKIVARVYPMEILPFVTLREGAAERIHGLFMQGEVGLGYGYSCEAVSDEYVAWVREVLEADLKKKLAKVQEVAAGLGIPERVPAPNTREYNEEGWERKMRDLQKACIEQQVDYVDLSWIPGDGCLGTDRIKAVWQMPNNQDKTGWLDEPKDRQRAHTFVGDDGSSGGRAAISPDDIDQGCLGDCWFMCSIAAITERPAALVLPMFDSKADGDNNCWTVVLGKGGWYQKYTIDGFLPVLPTLGVRNPIFARNKEQPTEMWVAMLEKAYARLHGTYQAIAGGDPADGLSELTGYPSTSFWGEQWDRFKADPELLYKVLRHHDDHNHLIYLTTPGVDTTSEGSGAEDEYKKLGLGSGHAYTCIAVREWKGDKLLKIRNPWGNAVEWKGDYGDEDKIWQGSDAAELKHHLRMKGPDGKTEIDYEPKFGDAGDGTWWMKCNDVVKYFDGVGVCLSKPVWWDCRWRFDISDGWGPFVMELTVTQKTKALVWCKQPDDRGVDAGWEERLTLAPLLATVLKKGAQEPTMDTVAESPFQFSAGSLLAFPPEHQEPRDFMMLEPGTTYYIVVRSDAGHSKKNVVAGLMSGKPCKLRPLRLTESMKQSAGYQGYFGFLKDGATTEGSHVDAQVNRVDCSTKELSDPASVKTKTGVAAAPLWWRKGQLD